MIIVMNEFNGWCGILSVQGAIDGTHISIVKPFSYPKDYYHHKTSRYNVKAQAIVDCKKCLLIIFVDLLGSVNDSRALCRSTFYKSTQCHGLFESNTSFNMGSTLHFGK
jgi:hypothetical protein